MEALPISVEALTARISGKQAAREREQELVETRPRRSLVAVRLPAIHQVFGLGTTFLQLTSLTRLRVSNIVREIPFWGILILMAGLAINNGHFAGRLADRNVWPVT